MARSLITLPARVARGESFTVRTLLQQPDLLDTPAPPPSPVEGSP